MAVLDGIWERVISCGESEYFTFDLRKNPDLPSPRLCTYSSGAIWTEALVDASTGLELYAQLFPTL